MEIKVCVGSACYVKGSSYVIEKLKELIVKEKLEKEIELKATFCLGNCMSAVSVQVEEEIYSVKKEDIEEFFDQVIRGKYK